MDGVIVNTEPLHRKSYFQMFEFFGLNVNNEMYETFTGQSTKNVCQRLIEEFNLNISREELINKKRETFKFLFDTDPEFDLVPGVKNLIKHYHQKGIKLVLASSASMEGIEMVFERFELDKYFVGKISGADLKESKPNPEIFIKATKIAKEPKENCIVIEDSTNGIEAAKSAGIYCVAFKNLHSINQDYSKADRLIEAFSELIE